VEVVKRRAVLVFDARIAIPRNSGKSQVTDYGRFASGSVSRLLMSRFEVEIGLTGLSSKLRVLSDSVREMQMSSLLVAPSLQGVS
jgi:hypothetical protein